MFRSFCSQSQMPVPSDPVQTTKRTKLAGRCEPHAQRGAGWTLSQRVGSWDHCDRVPVIPLMVYFHGADNLSSWPADHFISPGLQVSGGARCRRSAADRLGNRPCRFAWLKARKSRVHRDREIDEIQLRHGATPAFCRNDNVLIARRAGLANELGNPKTRLFPIDRGGPLTMKRNRCFPGANWIDPGGSARAIVINYRW
jgi:hypothetical protein